MAVAIIAEYNPFHNGHIYQLKKAKELFPNDEIVIILSSNYTQRGDFNVMDFEQRKTYALKYGASKVIALDFDSSTQAAHIFAHGAVKLIAQNNIDKLFFGSETDNIESFYKAARTLKNNKEQYNTNVKFWLKQGYSFVRASAEALKEINGENFVLPNDILGLEYVKQIVENNYKIEAFCMKRTIGFHSLETKENFASASKIREMIFDKNENYKKYTPVVFYEEPDRLKNHFSSIRQKIIDTDPKILAEYKLVSEGIENLLKKHSNITDFDAFVDACTSRRYTKTRIQRILLYIFLDIKK
ncbi:nucleotidyltransferase [Mycoplasma sp. 4044]